jgi:mono/diheme cytochrome c family protein
MKRVSIVLLALAMSTAAFAADGAALYKAKCSGCHGANGEGKMGPKIAGNTTVADVLTTGGKTKAPHTKPFANLTADEVKAIADYVAGLK